jgi:chromosome partitioning protein
LRQEAQEVQIITVAVIKGGTGKTTTAAALAQAAAKAGKRVLAIDLDPQANLTFFLGADQNSGGSYQLLQGADPAQLIQGTAQGVSVISGSPDLATERTKPGSAKRLQDALQAVRKDFDFIFVDTPPQMGELTFNALQAATGLIIPLETDNSSLQGLYQIADIAHQMQNTNPGLRIFGAILTRYDSRPKLNRYLSDIISEKGQEVGAPLIMGIRPGIAIREAQALQLSIYDYAPKSNPAQDYKKLFDVIQEG